MSQTVLQTNANQKKGFRQRQFQEHATSGQTKFDWIFGVIMPAICFLFDPIVFKSSSAGEALFAKYKPFAYVLSYISMMALFAFLMLGKKAKYYNAFFAGIFLTGGLVSLVVGIILFPVSLIGLFLMFVGILGFTPLLTAFVFLRNSFRAFQTAKPFLNTEKTFCAFVLTMILSFGVPLILNIQIERIFLAVKNGDAATVRANFRMLRIFAPIINPDRLIREYRYAGDVSSEKQAAIDELYYGITGKDITKQILID